MQHKECMMNFKVTDYYRLFNMDGFSRRLLENHLALYEGYVNSTNKLIKALAQMENDASSEQFSELKRRFGWEYNGMRLHEYYFDNLGGVDPLKKSGLRKAIERRFGTLAAWEKDFRATASLRGIGWAILYRDKAGLLFNTWINEHDGGHLAGCDPLLVLDVFEHAYMLDYGIKRDEYIGAFMDNVLWEIVSQRFDEASREAPREDALVGHASESW